MSLATAAAAEIAWLAVHPDFEERPASIREFLGPHYLNIEDGVRPAVRQVLIDIFGDEPNAYKLSQFRQAIATGGIGWGKSTVASIALTYMVHWLLCLRDPQKFFGLLPGSRIAAMMMSTSEPQARQVIFSDIKARIDNSPWFRMHRYDPKFRNQVRFPKDIWLIPGDSSETTFEGYNIICGVIDEIDSHKVTKQKDYAEQGWTTIYSRMTSRFGDRGFVFCVGQTKYEGSFASRHYDEMIEDPDSYAVKLALWDSIGWDKFLLPDGSRNSFFYDIRRKRLLSKELAAAIGGDEAIHLIEVPNAYRRDFENDPEKALRDLAGIPPSTLDPFITLDYKIEDAREEWLKWANTAGWEDDPVSDRGALASWVKPPDSLPRYAHIDIGISNDALGFAFGHSPGMVENDVGESKPYIIIDLVARLTAPPGGQIELASVRQLLYHLRDNLGFNFRKVTLDSYQSTDMMQQLKRRRFRSDLVSIDRTVTPYYDLREALYDGRLALPMVMSRIRPTDPPIDFLRKELVELQDLGLKIDHPPQGSKDLADAVAGVVTEIMASTRGHTSSGGGPQVMPAVPMTAAPSGYFAGAGSHRAVKADVGLRAPVPWRPPKSPGGR